MGDPVIDPAAQGSQGGPGSQPGGGASAPVTINAELLGEYKDDATLKSFEGKPVSEVFKWAANASKLIGGEKVVLPQGKLDTPENWQTVFDRLGRPKSADGYKLERPDLPEGMTVNEGFEKKFLAASHYLGLLPWQVKGLYQLYNGEQVAGFKDFEARQTELAEKSEAELIAELGSRQKYEEFVAGAHAALKKFAGDSGLVDEFIDKFGNDPTALRVFGNVARHMMEDAAIRGDKNFSLMGENAPAMVKDILNNQNNPLHKAYFEKNHPQHEFAVAEVARLNELIHGNKPINMAG